MWRNLQATQPSIFLAISSTFHSLLSFPPPAESNVAPERCCSFRKLPSALPRRPGSGTQRNRFLSEHRGENWHRWANGSRQIKFNSRPLQDYRSGRRENRDWWHKYCWNRFALIKVSLDNYPTRSRVVQRQFANEYWSVQLISRWCNMDSFRALAFESLCQGTVRWIGVQNFRGRWESISWPATTCLLSTSSVKENKSFDSRRGDCRHRSGNGWADSGDANPKVFT